MLEIGILITGLILSPPCNASYTSTHNPFSKQNKLFIDDNFPSPAAVFRNIK